MVAGPQRPRIGLTMNVSAPSAHRRVLDVPSDYVEAIRRGGGTVVLLPQSADPTWRQEMVASIDGLLIPGGDDIDPALYGQAPHPKTNLVNKDREIFDLAILSLAEARGLPTLGICLGCQLMNVYRRGTLHQHLPEVGLGGVEQITHSRPGDYANFHRVTIGPGSKLGKMMGSEPLKVNSRHHQGVAKLGHGLTCTAQSADGLTEAFEDASLPFWMAVQWHPENLGGSEHDKIFTALVAAADRYRKEAGR